MSFLKKIFAKKEEPIKDYADFWKWFQANEKEFYRVVKSHGNIEKNFFDRLSPKLAELKNGYFFLTGMYNEDTVELVFTADGNTCNIVFVEELVSRAPGIPGWKFTALKPALNVADISIEMAGYKFNSDTVSFYFDQQENYPDEINISVVHPDITEENRSQVANGVYIYLENILGELDFVNNIDELQIVGKGEATQELIPISKLRDFLTWRQKEFIEKYDGTGCDTEYNNRAIMEGRLPDGKMLIATMNTELLEWDSKASHPWIGIVTISYDGSGGNGMPGEVDYAAFNDIEEEIIAGLPDRDGYLYIGRQTADGEREIYFACKDFRKPSKIFFDIQRKYEQVYQMTYDIYKDKYWKSFERFRTK